MHHTTSCSVRDGCFRPPAILPIVSRCGRRSGLVSIHSTMRAFGSLACVHHFDSPSCASLPRPGANVCCCNPAVFHKLPTTALVMLAVSERASRVSTPFLPATCRVSIASNHESALQCCRFEIFFACLEPPIDAREVSGCFSILSGCTAVEV